jgi:hypothetical protein
VAGAPLPHPRQLRQAVSGVRRHCGVLCTPCALTDAQRHDTHALQAAVPFRRAAGRPRASCVPGGRACQGGRQAVLVHTVCHCWAAVWQHSQQTANFVHACLDACACVCVRVRSCVRCVRTAWRTCREVTEHTWCSWWTRQTLRVSGGACRCCCCCVHLRWCCRLPVPRHACALPCPALPCPALPCPALPCPALPCPALPCPALQPRAGSCRSRPAATSTA